MKERDYTQQGSFQCLNNPFIFKFEVFHLLVSLFFITWQLSFAITSEFVGLHLLYEHGDSSIAWIFTQFTWWTNILITILQFVRILLRKRNLNNRLAEFLFGKSWYINWVVYITVVGVLFFSGHLFMLLKDGKDFQDEVIDMDKFDKSFTNFVVISIKSVTYFVHLVNPLAYIAIFIVVIAKGYLIFDLREITHKRIFKNTCMGMIYPMLYLMFYAIFAFTNYDPYPISDLRANRGWWLAGFVPFFFFSLLFIAWKIARWVSLRKYNQFHPNAPFVNFQILRK